MIERLDKIEQKYNELNDQLVNTENINDVKLMTQLSKEQSGITDVYNKYQQYKQILKLIDDTKEMINDPVLGELAIQELEQLALQREEIEEKIEVMLLPTDPNDQKNVIMEIRGAAGGDEANIFAGDLYRMYTRYAEKEGWRIEVLNEEDSSMGGFSKVEILIKGKDVYSKLKYESGSHRVQRVPTTETQGRVHTSTATVLVMPEADEVDIEIKPNEIKVDVYRSGGAGGQSVNTTDSAVRMTHIPTGIVVTCQNERSQIQNREKALQILRARVYEDTLRKQEEEIATSRRDKIGTGDRSEKIRTYNYPQNRVTDHRISLTLKQLDRIMEGDLSTVIEPLIIENQNRLLKEC